jgi:predicted transcriptional regulator
MPLIRRQPKPPPRTAITCKLPDDLVASLRQYAEFLDSTQEHVIAEALRVVFSRDKEFQAWQTASQSRSQS